MLAHPRFVAYPRQTNCAVDPLRSTASTEEMAVVLKVPRWAIASALFLVPAATYTWMLWTRPNIYEQVRGRQGRGRWGGTV